MYVKLIDGRIIERLSGDTTQYLDETKLNNAGYKEFVPAIKEEGKPYTYSYEETATQIIEHVEEIIPDYEQIRREQFHRDFFNTSLGYIRRKVSMKTGETKDFLTDLLPVISIAVQGGQTVDIITYKEPDFTHDIEDWEALQEVKQATPQFIQDCFNQVNADFVGMPE